MASDHSGHPEPEPQATQPNAPAASAQASLWNRILNALQRLRARLITGVGNLSRVLHHLSQGWREERHVSATDLRAAFAHLRFGWLCLILLVLLLVGYGASSYYTVQPGERAVVRRFGQILPQWASEGLRYRLPWPIETATTVNLAEVHRVAIGLSQPAQRRGRQQPIPELEVLSGDVNMIDFEVITHSQIRDPAAYLFNINASPDHLVRDTVRAVVTQLSGATGVDALLTTERQTMQQSVRQEAQALLDRYGTGIDVVSVHIQKAYPSNEVADAFRDVASAMEDKTRAINEAEAYRNSILPEAKGQASLLLAEAKSYAAEHIDQAAGAAAAFNAMLTQYLHNSRLYGEHVTRWRLYLEQMEKSLPRLQLYMVQRGEQVNLRLLNGVRVMPPLPLSPNNDKPE